MMCPVCNATVFFDKHNTDFLHDCTLSAISSLRQEDRISYEGQQWNWQGIANKVQGSTAGILGEKVVQVNRRSNKTSLIVSRDRLTHIDTKNKIAGSNPL